MRKGINSDDNIRKGSISLDLGNLDLLNLRLIHPNSGNFNYKEGGSGDTHVKKVTSSSSHFEHPLKKVVSRANPNFQYLPKGYDRSRTHRLSPQAKLETNFNTNLEQFIQPKNPSNSGDAAHISNHTARSTRSGSIEIKSKHVIFESRSSTINLFENRKMAFGSGEYAKGSAMNAVLSQLNLSNGGNINSIIGDTPVRDSNRLLSEYESKETSQILDPELSLGRLGYTRNEVIDWRKVVLPDKKDLYTELCKRITSKKNADCTVQIGCEQFSCHFLVLQCYSELFEECTAMKKIGIPTDKCSADAFAFIYDWMISEYHSTKLTRENVLDIFTSAKYMRIKDLVEQCWAFVDNYDVFNEDSAFLLYIDAKNRNLKDVKELMLPRIQNFFLMLVSSQDWLELDVHDVKLLLSSNYVKINCEIEIFMSAVRWLKYDWDNRDKYKYEIINCVRFGNIAPWQLVDIKRNPENPEFMELAQDPAICKLIDDGMAYIIIKNWYGHDNENNDHWNNILGLQRPSSRNWTNVDKTYFTYREFIIYLDIYRRDTMIEKTRPKSKDLVTDIGVVSHSSHDDSVPSMEDFLTKKKVISARHTPKSRCITTMSSIFHDMRVTPSKDFKIIARHDSTLSIHRLFTPRYSQSQILSESSLFFPDSESILILGGLDYKHAPCEGRNSAREIFRYIPKLNAWEPVGKIPEPRHQHKVQFYKGRIYLAGGCDPRYKGSGGAGTVWTFDPVTRNWLLQPNMIMGRRNFEMVVFNKNLFVIGGESYYNEALNTVEILNPDDGLLWVEKTPMKYARSGLSCVKYRNVIWAAGGLNQKQEVLDVVESYDVKHDQWTVIQKLSSPRAFSSMIVMSDVVYLIGGWNTNNSLNIIEKWDSQSDQWKSLVNLGIQRHGLAVGHIEDRIYSLGGFTTVYNQTLSNNECFCTKEGKWIRGIAPLPVALAGHAAVTLPPANLLTG